MAGRCEALDRDLFADDVIVEFRASVELIDSVSVAIRLIVHCEFASEDVSVDFVVGAWDVGETSDVAFCAFLVHCVLVSSGSV